MPRTESRRQSKRRNETPESTQPTTDVVATSKPENEPSAAPATSEPASSSGPSKLGIVMKEDGTFDIDAMRSSTKERLRKALSDPALGSKLGVAIEGAPLASADAFFGPAICSILYDTSSKLMIALALRSGYPPEQAITLAFTKEEIEQLAPLTGKILDKWIPIGGKYQDEAMLCLMLFSIVNGKMALLRKPAKVVPMPVPAAERVSPPEGSAS